MGELLSGLKEWLAYIWPFTKLSLWQRALRETYYPAYRRPVFCVHTVGGRPFVLVRFEMVEAHVVQEELGPGMHRKIPWLDEVHDVSTAEDPIKLEVQNVTTRDGRSVTVRAVIVYEVFNVTKATLEVHDYESSVKHMAEVNINRIVRANEWVALLAEQDRIEAELREQLHDRVKKWGVRIKEVGFSTFVNSEQVNRFNVN